MPSVVASPSPPYFANSGLWHSYPCLPIRVHCSVTPLREPLNLPPMFPGRKGDEGRVDNDSSSGDNPYLLELLLIPHSPQRNPTSTTMTSATQDAAFLQQFLSADVQAFAQNMTNIGTPRERLRQAHQPESPECVYATGRSPITTAILHRAPGLCFEDANIALVAPISGMSQHAGQQLVFCLYKGLLANASPVFKKLFEHKPNEFYEGLLMYRMSGYGWQLRCFLEALLQPS